MPNLTCYKAPAKIAGRDVADFDDLIDVDDGVQIYGPLTGRNFTAKLFVTTTPPHEPSWAGFLRDGFGDDLRFARVRSVSAVLIVRTTESEPAFFALTFGQGRYMLRDGAFERNFGLRCVLNMAYPTTGDEFDPSRIRAVDTKRVGANTVKTRSQASRATTLETFEFDYVRDLLRQVVGRPVDSDVWGSRVTGGDSVGLTSDVDFDGLGDLCARLVGIHSRTDYRDRFGWIDHVRWVQETELVGQLEEAVVTQLRSRSHEELELAPPELVDWDQLARFDLPFERKKRPPVRRLELRLEDFLSVLHEQSALADLDVTRLKRWNLRGLDADGKRIHEWHAWRCLTGTIELGDATYVLDDGDFYEVATDYLAALDEYVDGVGLFAGTLPPAEKGMVEAEYNRIAAEDDAYLLLDRKTLRVESSTTSIEVCDLLSGDGAFIHVKRKLGSSGLSHLFAQGFTSADTMHGNGRFRTDVHSLVSNVANGDAFLEGLDPATYSSRDHEVVFAVIADWRRRSVKDALPFFSKVTLRRTTEQLRRIGYKVAFAQVHLAV